MKLLTFRLKNQTPTARFFAGLLLSLVGIIAIIPGFGIPGILWTALSIILTVSNGILLYRTQKHPAPNEEDPSRYSLQKKLFRLCQDYDSHLIPREDYEREKLQLLEQLEQL